ncbi:excinuclease ABC subunit UvrA [candidate division WOR-3 bacterium]|uniref:UvrABC system protein A n=1 Tax=candidate division WOR-3 bacterium TaxID=2052148 RepID=A0A937XD61_UNCW3|nr:excinuclease ABC subunit UvrA [candidate division WOR-3 bacterium]
MSRDDVISIRGAREHNLKNISLDIPRNKLVVITGLSGSGKSSLAFDTIYAEGQRRYIESLSAYARQFLGMLEKPDCDQITGLSPAIAIEQRTSARNPRSTVGTVTEIYDYLRLLFARIGKPYCPKCGKPISSQTTDQIVDNLLALTEGTNLIILAPLIRARKGEYKELLVKAKRRGYIRVRVDGKLFEVDEVPDLERYKKHDIEVVVDRLQVKPDARKRLADSVELALKEGNGLCIVATQRAATEVQSPKSKVPSPESRAEGGDLVFSAALACPECGYSLGEISPRLFSFNAPQGACPTCHGLGTKMEIDPDRVISNPDLSVMDGALQPWGEARERSQWFTAPLKTLARRHGFKLDTPWKKLPAFARRLILYGSEEDLKVKYTRWDDSEFYWQHKFEGLMPNLLRLYHETESESRREWIEGFMTLLPCPDCQGRRLKPEALAVRIGDVNIAELSAFSIRRCHEYFMRELKLTGRDEEVSREVIKELRKRLGFLTAVGIDYLTLDRTAETLGGGEAQRVRLATQIGSGLVGVVYILDEPSIGLHQRDNRKLLGTLTRLRDLGNTVIVVEHDEETILEADHVIDLGPGAGDTGGRVVAQGPPQEIKRNPDSLTGAYLSGRKSIALPAERREPRIGALTVQGCKENNLKNTDISVPLGLFVAVTGVSGSGKSTFVSDILYRALARHFYDSREKPGAHDHIAGIEKIDKVINIDQSPIGRTPRSNPATYTGAFGPIRELFARTKDARMRGYKPGRFSFNVKGGRCEACGGDGIIKVEMHFLPDVYVTCEVCRGRRYNRETLEVKYKTKSISDVLEMSVLEADLFFANVPAVARKVRLLEEVGLGYVKLGQSATTLSGGEAQRIKLARELSKIATGRTLYLLDEPTTGLHFEDVRLLLGVLDRLVARGNTVLVIEHNLEVIKCADWIIDLGPEGGDEGGTVVVAGTPEKVASCESSHTGKYLKPLLRR